MTAVSCLHDPIIDKAVAETMRALGLIEIQRGTTDDIDDLVALGARLFEEDADKHDTYIDLAWSARQGQEDFRQLLASHGSLVLIARDGSNPVGHLVGYVAEASPTRQPVRFAILRSMYIDHDHRRNGTGRRFVEQFLSWAGEQNCVEAHVSSYVANDQAQLFYEALGFKSRSLSRARTL